jgi:hypothetical protein
MLQLALVRMRPDTDMPFVRIKGRNASFPAPGTRAYHVRIETPAGGDGGSPCVWHTALTDNAVHLHGGRGTGNSVSLVVWGNRRVTLHCPHARQQTKQNGAGVYRVGCIDQQPEALLSAARQTTAPPTIEAFHALTVSAEAVLASAGAALAGHAESSSDIESDSDVEVDSSDDMEVDDGPSFAERLAGA